MSKYDRLWRYVAQQHQGELLLSWQEAETVLGFALDHSFLTYKKELLSYGYCVKKISIKAQTVLFART